MVGDIDSHLLCNRDPIVVPVTHYCPRHQIIMVAKCSADDCECKKENTNEATDIPVVTTLKQNGETRE
jgi:hypothetical protein